MIAWRLLEVELPMSSKQVVLLAVSCALLVALGGEAFAKKPIVAVFAIKTSKSVQLRDEALTNLGLYLASRLTSSGAYGYADHEDRWTLRGDGYPL